MNKFLIRGGIYLTLIIFSLASFGRLVQLLLRVENLFLCLLVLLFISSTLIYIYLKGFKKFSYIFIFFFILTLVLGPEIIGTIFEIGQLGWYDEIDGQIGFALTQGSISKSFNHFWAGGTPYNHGFLVGNLPLYFSKKFDISIYSKILYLKIIYWFLALGIPLRLIYSLKKYRENDVFGKNYFVIYKLLFIFAIVNNVMFHGWVFARGFIGPLVVVYITFIRSNQKKNNFYIFLFALLIYLFGSFIIPSFSNAALEALFSICLINIVDILEYKKFANSISYKLATIIILSIIFFIIFNQLFILREVNFDEFSRLTRISYPKINDIFLDIFRNANFNVALGSICLIGLSNKFLRFRSFLYFATPISLVFILSLIFTYFDFDLNIFYKLKVLRPSIFFASWYFLLLDLVLIIITNKFEFKRNIKIEQ